MQTSDGNMPVRFEARKWREPIDTTREERDPETHEYRDVPLHLPAEWAVYDIESGVRMDYSKSEEAAKATAEKWNADKMPEGIRNKAESARDLRKLLNPGDEVKTILRSVSRSGMSRRISLVIARDNEVIDISWDTARVMGDNVKQGGKYVQDAGLAVGGCGMDMGFHVVYTLSRILFPDGFVCSGESCKSNDHFNDHSPEMRRAAFKGQRHTGDGGYALNHRWL